MTTTIYYDLESTGLSPLRARIVQLAATTGAQDFVTLVQPGVPVPAEASAVHGLTDECLQGAPVFSAAWDAFRLFVARVCEPQSSLRLVGHNSRYFDDRMLVAELERHGIGGAASTAGLPIFDLWRGDIYVAARQLRSAGGLPPKTELNLRALHQRRLNAPLENAHDALADCRAVWKLLEGWPELQQRLDFEPWSTAVASLQQLRAGGGPGHGGGRRKRALPLPAVVGVPGSLAAGAEEVPPPASAEVAGAQDVAQHQEATNAAAPASSEVSAAEPQPDGPQRKNCKQRTFRCSACGSVSSLHFLHRCATI